MITKKEKKYTDNTFLEIKISEYKCKLASIFNRYTNNEDFENLTVVPFIYKMTIKFVPVELKDDIEELFQMIEKLKEQKQTTSRRR